VIVIAALLGPGLTGVNSTDSIQLALGCRLAPAAQVEPGCIANSVAFVPVREIPEKLKAALPEFVS